MGTLVLNLDDPLKLRLEELAARNHKPLPDWAAEQLSSLADRVNESPADYSEDWMAAFGSISDPTFDAPARPLPLPIDSLDA